MPNLGAIQHERPLEVTAIPGDCQTSDRLAALGILPGVRLNVIRRAPLNDPISLLLDGRETSIRRRDANLIEIKELA